MSDPFKLKFSQKEREDIQKCLHCPMPDCFPEDCPHFPEVRNVRASKRRYYAKKRAEILARQAKLRQERKRRKNEEQPKTPNRPL